MKPPASEGLNFQISVAGGPIFVLLLKKPTSPNFGGVEAETDAAKIRRSRHQSKSINVSLAKHPA